MREEKWTERQLEKLKELVNYSDLTNKQIAIELNNIFNTHRTVNSIEHKMRNMLLSKPLNNNKGKDNSMDFILENKDKLIKELRKNIFKDDKIKDLIKIDKDAHEEKCVLLMGDIHCGMINKIFDRNSGCEVVTYDTRIRQRETICLRNSIVEIKQLLSHSFTLNHLIIFNLGDIITNDRIFSGQGFHIDKCVGLQVMEMVTDLSNFISEMKKIFKKVTMVCMVGNHGRSNPDSNYDEPLENNYEFLMYHMIKSIFDKDERVELIIPTTKFYIYKIYEHKYLITHGDLIRGFTRNSIERSLKDYVIANESDFDVLCMGHLHRIDKLSLSEHNLALINGSWIEKDNFGFKVARQYSKPQQIFFGVSRKRSMTWDFTIDLKEN